MRGLSAMRIKSLLLSFVTLLALTGCFANPTEIKPETVEIREKPVAVNEDIHTLDQVKKAFEAEGIEMFPKEEQTDWVLNHVTPHRFFVSRPTEKAVYPEFISIYVYESEQARKEGLEDFNIQKEKYDMQIPNIYEHNNVLILYWHHENLDNANHTKFGKSIEVALQKL
jgi:hypothetical protein